MTPAILAFMTMLLSGPDNNVEWSGISHIGWLDRRPLCPVNGQPFTVYFQAYVLDLTSARVHVLNDGVESWIDAGYDHDSGPYAIWRADIPAMTGSTLSYWLELTDGDDSDYYSVSGMSDEPPTDGGFLIDKLTLAHAPLGATPVTGGVVFRVWAPTATQAWVRGEFNGWNQTSGMNRLGSDFLAFIPAATALQQYKYFFNPGGIWKPDARPGRLNPSDNYNSIVQNSLAYVWSDHAWRPPAFDDILIYELHVGTFAGRNDPLASGAIPATFRDVAAHAGHFADLGVNMVELMPPTEFPTDFSMGYNPITAWSPDWKLGTPDDLKYMVDTLHANGIGVLVDIVWNHFSPTDNYLWNYDSAAQQIYFKVPDVQTPWGSQADFSRLEVRQYYLDSGLSWIDNYHVDGFRMDATDYMNAYQPDGWGLMQSFNNALDNRASDRISIAEQLPNDAWITRPAALGGAGFDAQWHDRWVDNLRSATFAAAFGNPDMNSLATALNGDGEYLTGRYLLRYFEGHDEVMASTGGARAVNVIDTTAPHDDLWAKGRTKLAQGLTFLVPGIPMIFMGDEWLEDTDLTAGDGSGAGRIDWSKLTTYARIYQFYKDLIAVRRDNPAFRASAAWQVFHVDDSANVLAFQRWDDNGNVCVVAANFGNSDIFGYRVGLPQPGPWTEVLNSQSSLYDGNNVGNAGAIASEPTPWDGYAQSAAITLPQMGLLVFRWGPAPVCVGDLNNDGLVDLTDLATQLAHYGLAGSATPADGDLDSDQDVDLSDLAMLLANYGAPCP